MTRTIAFIGRRQNIRRRWSFAVDGLERGRVDERRAAWIEDEAWRERWRRAMRAARLDFGALEFFDVEGGPLFLEANPMWGARHRFGPEMTRWLREEAPGEARARAPHRFTRLDPYAFYRRYWRAVSELG